MEECGGEGKIIQCLDQDIQIYKVDPNSWKYICVYTYTHTNR